MYRHGWKPLAAGLAMLMLGGCGPVPGMAVKASLDGPPVVPDVELNGLYRVVSDGTGVSNGEPSNGLEKVDQQWAFRSFCDADGCVATAGIVDPDDPTKTPEVIEVADYVDGRWLMTTVGEYTCHEGAEDFDAALWTMWEILPAGGNALSVKRIEIATDSCNWIDRTTPTLARVGDLPDGLDLPSPELEPLRDPDPDAAAFHGNYDLTATSRVDYDSVAYENDDVETWCERTGDRCVSAAMDTAERAAGEQFLMTVFQYEDGEFVHTFSEASPPCNGAVGGLKTQTIRLTMPTEFANPLAGIAGERTTTYPGGCEQVVDDVVFERAS